MIESKGHKITPIDGDLAVSRNAEIGGDTDIHGKARVAGSLKVEGFLDAPNIKGAVKGLFATEEELKREYPNPRPGWCAIVLADKESGFLYLAKNREWEKQSEEAQPFDFIVDSINVFASKDELQTEKTEREEVEKDIKEELDKTLKYTNTGFNQLDDVVELECWDSAHEKHIAASIYPATETVAGVMSAPDKRALDKVADDIDKKQTVVQVEWVNEGNVSNMNDFVEAGIYEIKGERKRIDDNLPFGNTGGGHTFHARLEVLDSSIAPEGKSDDICITQKLTLSNRVAGDGDVYIRTGRGTSKQSITWETWGKLQQNIEVGSVATLDNLIDNGIYSGVWLQGHYNSYPITFVCVVINDYFIGVTPRRISQFVYGLSKFDGSVVYQSRVWDDSKNEWSNWEILNKNEISSMIADAVKDINAKIDKVVTDITEGVDPNTIDSIKDLANWIEEHGSEVEAIYNAIEDNTKKIDEEIERSGAADSELLSMIDAEQRRAEQAEQSNSNAITAERTRAMGQEGLLNNAIVAERERADAKIAEEKERAEKHLANEVEKLKDGNTIVAQAREIHSRNGKTVTDSFLARTTAGSGTIGDGVATLKSVGGNIVKNLVDGTFESGWGARGTLLIADQIAYIKKGTDTLLQVVYSGSRIIGHRYYACVCAKSNGRVGLSFNNLYENNIHVTPDDKWVRLSVVGKHTNDAYKSLIIRELQAENMAVCKPLLIDLTETFGETKANQITKEECDKLFGTMDALPQGLTIANPTEFKSIGYNQADPNKVLANKGIENGAIVDKVGSNIAVVPCLPCKIGTGENNGYCIHGAFDEGTEKVYLTPLNPLEVEGELYLCELTKDADKGTYVPQIKGYMLVEVPNATDLCVHFLWSEDCDRNAFEPYFESKVELSTILEMSEYGLAGIQSSGELACDEIDFVKGVYRKKIGAVDMGSLNWIYNTTYNKMYSDSLPLPINGNVLTEIYTTAKSGFPSSSVADKSIYSSLNNNRLMVYDTAYSDAKSFKAALQGVILYYELAEPIEYPLPKVANNYTSSDYGTEQFDSVVPCNANNLYYMRSLAGETRDFLDKMYANTAKTDAKEVADYITNAPNLALRALYIAAGAEYNDSGVDKTKTAPWGETVTHKAGCYYLNGLGDITEEQMSYIYISDKFWVSKDARGYMSGYKSRTNIPAPASELFRGYKYNFGGALLETYIEVLVLCNPKSVSESYRTIIVENLDNFGFYSTKLKRVFGTIKLQNTNKTKLTAPAIEYIYISELKCDFEIRNTKVISQESVLYMIQKATPTSAITITLHADAYARLANDADIVAALAAQPLVTLVSA